MLGFIGILFLYFFVGALLDILSVIDFKAVQYRQAFKSAVVTFISTMVSTYCFYYIVKEPDALLEITMYALGGSVGTYYLLTKGYNEDGTELQFPTNKSRKERQLSVDEKKNSKKKRRISPAKRFYRYSRIFTADKSRTRWVIHEMVIHRK